jgi:protein SCO1/2
MKFRPINLVLLLLAGLAVASAPGRALAQAPFEVQQGAASPQIKQKFLDGIGIDQKLGAQVPLDLTFTDEDGKPVKLAKYFDGAKKPVILALVYYNCPNICTMVLNDLNRGMNGLTLSAGDDFEVVTVSFDPREGPEIARDKKEQYMHSYRRDHAAQGWHFLTGNEKSIKALTDSVGFKFRYDPKYDQYVHPSGLIILTPQGRVSRYFFGVDYDLKDLRLSLEEASGNKIGTLTDKLLLFCFHYDETSGKYTVWVTRFLKLGGVLTVGGIGAFWLAMFYRDQNLRGTGKGSGGTNGNDQNPNPPTDGPSSN